MRTDDKKNVSSFAIKKKHLKKKQLVYISYFIYSSTQLPNFCLFILRIREGEKYEVISLEDRW